MSKAVSYPGANAPQARFDELLLKHECLGIGFRVSCQKPPASQLTGIPTVTVATKPVPRDLDCRPNTIAQK